MNYDQLYFRYDLRDSSSSTFPNTRYTVYEPKSFSGIQRQRYSTWSGEVSFADFDSLFNAIQNFFRQDKHPLNTWFGSGGFDGSGGSAECAAISDLNPCEENVFTDVFNQIDADDICGVGRSCGDHILMDIYKKELVIRAGGFNGDTWPVKILATRNPDCALTPERLSISSAWNTFFTVTLAGHLEDTTVTFINFYWEYDNEAMMPEINPQTVYPYWQRGRIDMYYDHFSFRYVKDSSSATLAPAAYSVYEPSSPYGITTRRIQVLANSEVPLDSFEKCFDAIKTFFDQEKNSCYWPTS